MAVAHLAHIFMTYNWFIRNCLVSHFMNVFFIFAESLLFSRSTFCAFSFNHTYSTCALYIYTYIMPTAIRTACLSEIGLIQLAHKCQKYLRIDMKSKNQDRRKKNQPFDDRDTGGEMLVDCRSSVQWQHTIRANVYAKHSFWTASLWNELCTVQVHSNTRNKQQNIKRAKQNKTKRTESIVYTLMKCYGTTVIYEANMCSGFSNVFINNTCCIQYVLGGSRLNLYSGFIFYFSFFKNSLQR